MGRKRADKKCGCGQYFRGDQGLADHQAAMNHTADTKPFRNAKRHTFDPENQPDWTSKCENCDATPVHPQTGMCGPCTFGEASTINGNW